ncbi:DUF11 domain-containing protein [Kistimonas asteriae]|uniref:DUF11 domain-containing protein n=1 Tax=Kistimonas asteriae TaxID=517724 RepID=UPI001BAA4C6E|nr:DUF11 domain-containing protein [Kistimonas asteriae]
MALLLLGAAAAQAAITPAGTVIKNLATVTYTDSLGNAYSAQSNESVVTVAEVYDPVLEKDQSKEAAPGQTVYFPHQLINKGNTRETFTALRAVLSGNTAKTFKVYHDINGNGQPDAGEPEITELIVEAGSVGNIVVAVQVSASTQTGTSFTVDVTAQPTKGNALSNRDTVTVSNGPVLVATKSEIKHTPAKIDDKGAKVDGTVEYSVTVKNNGTTAKNAEIYDFLPTLLDSSSVQQMGSDSRLTDFDGDKVADEASLPASVSLPDYVAKDKAVFAKIPTLKAGETVTLKFRATYKYDDADPFSADDVLRNKAYVFYGKDGDLGKTPTPKDPNNVLVETNEVTTKLPAFFDFEAHGRDSNWAAKTDTVSEAISGSVAVFKVKITNKGNGEDAFTLDVPDTGSFPAKTTFSFWDQTGTISLNKVTPTIAKGGEYIVTIKANLPEGGKADKSEAKLKLTSKGDNKKTDEVALILTKIKDSTGSVDLAYRNTQDQGPDRDAYTSAVVVEPAPSKNYQKVKPDSTVEYEFTLYNESPEFRSYNLKALGSVTGSHGSYGEGSSLPKGWTVVFADENGTTLSSTQPVPAGSSINLTARLTVAADAPAVVKQPFAVLAEGQKGGNDALKFFATVERIGELTLTPNGANQIEPGGAVFYSHELRNLSNDPIQGDITLTGEGLDAGWSYQFFVADEKGQIQGSGLQTMTIDGSLLTQKDAVYRIKVKVMAPANARPGVTKVLTLNAEYQLGTESVKRTATATDSTTVIKGQIRLYKKVKVLSGKNKTEEAIKQEAEGLSANVFATNSTEKVIPNQDYVVWQIIARNEGDADANQVTIRDAAPEFTTLVAGSAEVVTDQMGVVAEENTTSGDVVFNIGEGATQGKDSNGILKPGEFVEVRFTVKVN